MASADPTSAVVEAAPVLANGGAGFKALYTDSQSGAELAGLNHAYALGVTSISSDIATLGSDIVNDTHTNFSDKFQGDQAYGLAFMGQNGIALNAGTYYAPGAGPTTAYTDATAVVTYYYNTVVGTTTGAIDTTAANVVSPTDSFTNPDTYGLHFLSYHVLATNLLQTTNSTQWRDDLALALGNLNTTTADTLSEGNGDYGAVETLALSLYALKTAGFGGASVTGGVFDANHILGARTDVQLKAQLLAELDPNGTFYAGLTDHTGVAPGDPGYGGSVYNQGYIEDLSYGILALEAFNDPLDLPTIDALKAKLAEAVGQTGTGQVPVVYGEETTAAAGGQFAGAALQALPEPATLSLLGLSGMALLARRRRNA